MPKVDERYRNLDPTDANASCALIEELLAEVDALSGRVFCLNSEVAYLRAKLEPKLNGGW